MIFIISGTLEASPGPKLGDLQCGEALYQDLWVNYLLQTQPKATSVF